MYEMSCEVIKDVAITAKNEVNVLYFTVSERGVGIKGLPLSFSCNGSAKLSTVSQVTDGIGRCSVVVGNDHAEDISVKAVLTTEDVQDYQYGILTFR